MCEPCDCSSGFYPQLEHELQEAAKRETALRAQLEGQLNAGDQAVQQLRQELQVAFGANAELEVQCEELQVG